MTLTTMIALHLRLLLLPCCLALATLWAGEDLPPRAELAVPDAIAPAAELFDLADVRLLDQERLGAEERSARLLIHRAGEHDRHDPAAAGSPNARSGQGAQIHSPGGWIRRESRGL